MVQFFELDFAAGSSEWLSNNSQSEWIQMCQCSNYQDTIKQSEYLSQLEPLLVKKRFLVKKNLI